MLRPGLVSITFRELSIREIVELVARVGLEGIEWGGDVHVPHGDTSSAREALHLTREAGLEVAAYGSYYRVGHSEDEGLSFGRVLHTAIELEAPLLRVWAGRRGSSDADDDYRKLIINETRHICDKATQAGIRIAYEFHSGTLADSAASARVLLDEVAHPNLQTMWQPPVGASGAEAMESLREVLPYLANLHVFHWEKSKRCLLHEGAEAWREYFATARESGRRHWACLEFVLNDAPDSFLEDARTLKSLLDYESNSSKKPSGIEAI